MTRTRKDGTEVVAVSTSEHATRFHEIGDDGEIVCGHPLSWVRKDRPQLEARGYSECQHCYGTAAYGRDKHTQQALLEADPDEVFSGP